MSDVVRMENMDSEVVTMDISSSLRWRIQMDETMQEIHLLYDEPSQMILSSQHHKILKSESMQPIYLFMLPVILIL